MWRCTRLIDKELALILMYTLPYLEKRETQGEGSSRNPTITTSSNKDRYGYCQSQKYLVPTSGVRFGKAFGPTEK